MTSEAEIQRKAIELMYAIAVMTESDEEYENGLVLAAEALLDEAAAFDTFEEAAGRENDLLDVDDDEWYEDDFDLDEDWDDEELGFWDSNDRDDDLPF